MKCGTLRRGAKHHPAIWVVAICSVRLLVHASAYDEVRSESRMLLGWQYSARSGKDLYDQILT